MHSQWNNFCDETTKDNFKIETMWCNNWGYTHNTNNLGDGRTEDALKM